MRVDTTSTPAASSEAAKLQRRRIPKPAKVVSSAPR
jgi:hypothetical protein